MQRCRRHSNNILIGGRSLFVFVPIYFLQRRRQEEESVSLWRCALCARHGWGGGVLQSFRQSAMGEERGGPQNLSVQHASGRHLGFHYVTTSWLCSYRPRSGAFGSTGREQQQRKKDTPGQVKTMDRNVPIMPVNATGPTQNKMRKAAIDRAPALLPTCT